MDIAEWLSSPWVPWVLFLLSEGLERSPFKSSSVIALIINAAKSIKKVIPMK